MVKIRGEAKIWIDCDGNVDSDVYLEKEDIESFKQYLESKGFKILGVFKHEKSFETNRPFRYYKPSVQKRVTREVDWENPEVIEEVLTDNASDEIVLKKIIQISGKIQFENSKATPFTIQARHRFIDREYNKWKIENNTSETPQNKKELVREFAKYHIEMLKKQRQRRIQVGTRIYVPEADKEGEVIKYENGEYRIRLADGFQGAYKRSELIVKEKLENTK